VVEEIRFTKQGVALKMASQQHAAELIGKTFGMFKDVLDVEGDLTIIMDE